MTDSRPDAFYMRRALALAWNAWPRPNPRVGAVIVRDGRIVGRGRHLSAGSEHAEILALRGAGSCSRGATLYVTLEPCCHFGRTGPCTAAIISAGISRVVAGCADPNPKVAGGGIEALRHAGIQVVAGIAGEECERLIAGHSKYMRFALPHVVWKYAMTLDGKVATVGGQSQWITGERARAEVHRMRRRSDAVAIGIGTAMVDNPRLTARPPGAGLEPYRMVFDSRARLPRDSAVLAEPGGRPVVFVSEGAPQGRRKVLEEAGALVFAAGSSRVPARAAMQLAASELDVRDVLLEGGPELAASFLQEGLIDEIVCFVSGKLFGGEDAPGPLGGAGIRFPCDATTAHITRVKRFGEDVAIYASLTPGE